MQVPGLKFVSQTSDSSDKQENAFEDRKDPSVPFGSIPTAPKSFTQRVTSPYSINGQPIPSAPSAWSIPSQPRSMSGFGNPPFSSSNIMGSAQAANGVRRRSESPEIGVSKRQRLNESIPRGPASSGPLAPGRSQAIRSSAVIPSESFTGQEQVTSMSNHDKALAIRKAKAQRYKLNKAMRKEAHRMESLQLDAVSQPKNHFDKQNGLFEAQQIASTANVVSPVKPKAVTSSIMEIAKLITNDIDHPISANEWISSGIRPSPFPSPKNPQSMSLADAWRVFQSKTTDYRSFPLLPLLLVRQHLLSTLWHFTASHDRRRYISAPEVMAGGVNMFQALLSAIGCYHQSKCKLPNKKWKFVFGLDMKEKPQFSGTMWTHILDKAASGKILDVGKDQLAFAELISAWEPHRAAETTTSQLQPEIPSPTPAKEYQTTTSSDDGARVKSQDCVLSALSTQTKMEFMWGAQTSESWVPQEIPSSDSQPPEINSPSVPIYAHQKAPSVSESSQVSLPHTVETSAEALPSNEQSGSPQLTVVEDKKGSTENSQVEASILLGRGELSGMGTSTTLPKETAEDTPLVDAFEHPTERTPSSQLKGTPIEVRLAELKSRILQSSLRRTTPSELQTTAKPLIPKRRARASDYFSEGCLSNYFDFSDEFEPIRVPSPELIVPPEDEWWDQLNYEKRSGKVDLEYLNSFLQD
jgi:hypothetical protein